MFMIEGRGREGVEEEEKGERMNENIRLWIKDRSLSISLAHILWR